MNISILNIIISFNIIKYSYELNLKSIREW